MLASMEYCSREDRHRYELFLQFEEIERGKTQVGHPQSNELSERLHRTLLGEQLRVKERTTWYESAAEMKGDLDAGLRTYNRNRSHPQRRHGGTDAGSGLQGGIRKPRSRKKSPRSEVKTAPGCLLAA